MKPFLHFQQSITGWLWIHYRYIHSQDWILTRLSTAIRISLPNKFAGSSKRKSHKLLSCSQTSKLHQTEQLTSFESTFGYVIQPWILCSMHTKIDDFHHPPFHPFLITSLAYKVHLLYSQSHSRAPLLLFLTLFPQSPQHSRIHHMPFSHSLPLTNPCSLPPCCAQSLNIHFMYLLTEAEAMLGKIWVELAEERGKIHTTCSDKHIVSQSRTQLFCFSWSKPHFTHTTIDILYHYSLLVPCLLPRRREVCFF